MISKDMRNEYLENILKRYLDKNITTNKTKVVRIFDCLPKNVREGLNDIGVEIAMFLKDELLRLKKSYAIITIPHSDMTEEELVKMDDIYFLYGIYFIFVDKKVNGTLTIEVPKNDIVIWTSKKYKKDKYLTTAINKRLKRKINIKITGI